MSRFDRFLRVCLPVFLSVFSSTLLFANQARGATQYLVIRGPTTVQSDVKADYYSYLRDGATGAEKAVNVNWSVYTNGALCRTYYGYHIGFTMNSTEDASLVIAGRYSTTTVKLAATLKALSIHHSEIQGSSTIAPGATELYSFYKVYSNGQKLLKSADWWVSAEDGTEHMGTGTGWTISGFLYNLVDVPIVLNAIGGDSEKEQASKIVTFKAWSPTELVLSGPSSIHSNGEADFSATAVLRDQEGKVVASLQVPVAWSIPTGAAYGSIDDSGHFKAASTRKERKVVLQASYKGKAAKMDLTITPKAITSLRVEGPSLLEAGSGGEYVSVAAFDDGTEEIVDSRWTLTGSGASGKTVGPCPAIGWTAPFVERDTTFSIRAVCEGVSGTLPVTVRAETLVSLEILGPNTVPSRAQGVAYRCIATFSGGTKKTVEATWTIERGQSYVTGRSGSLVLDFTSTLAQLDNAVALRASFLWGGKTRSSESFRITICHKTEQTLVLDGPDRLPSGEWAKYTATVYYDDGTSETATPVSWSLTPEIDSISAGGWLDTQVTDAGRIDVIEAVYRGEWAIVAAGKAVRVLGRGTEDPDIEGLTLHTLHVRHDNSRIRTPEWEIFRAIGVFGDEKGNLFERDVTALCDWDLPSRSDWNVSSLYGNLLQAENYTASWVFVRVRATYIGPDGRCRTASASITIDPPISPVPDHRNKSTPPSAALLDHLEIAGPDTVASRGKATYVCRAVYEDKTVALVSPAWTIPFGKGDSINAEGVLQAAAAQRSRTIQIQAAYGGKTGTKTVTVRGRQFSSISISGPSSVPSGGKEFYSCTAHYDDGTTELVWPSWSVSSGAQYGSMDSSGTFTASEVEATATVGILARYEGKSANKTISIVPSGIKPALVSVPIYRFYSKKYRGHFFTMDEEEKDSLINSNPNWHYEGIAYYAFGEKGAGMATLHRFYSKKYKGHFFTIDENEKNQIIAGNPNWKYEGEAYYVYPTKTEGTVPVFRFWSKEYRHHFYTTSEEEKNDLIAHNPKWKYEGIAFYALSGEIAAPAGSTVEALSVSGPSSVTSGGTALLSCTALFADGSAKDVEPAWSIVSGGKHDSIDSTGVLTAGESDVGRTVTARASWNGFTADFTLAVEVRVPVPENLEIGGEAYLAAGDSCALTCAVSYDNGTSETITPEWRIVSGGTLGVLSPSGVFQATAGTEGGPVEIEAAWHGLTTAWTIWIAGGTENGVVRSVVVDGIEWVYSVTNGAAWIGVTAGEWKPAIPTNTSGDIEIPSTLGGFPVVGIADWAFSGCKNILSVDVPEGVLRIGEGAFGYCSMLQSISLPASLKELGDGVFYFCGDRTISLPSSNAFFKLVDGVLFSKDGKRLIRCPEGVGSADGKTYAIPAGTETIEVGAFTFSWKTSITIPNGVKNIREAAFLFCQLLEAVTIPASVSFIDETAFGRCESVSSFAVAANNPSYKSVDGVLFSKDGKTLLFHPIDHGRTSYSVPSGVTRLGWSAFFFCQRLESLVIPESVSEIDGNAIWGLTGLQTLTIPVRFKDFVEINDLPASCNVIYTATRTLSSVEPGAELASRDAAFVSRRVVAANGPAIVTTSDGSDGSAVADGEEATAWSPKEGGASWVVLSFAEACEMSDVEVVGDNLPPGTRMLFSEDADVWQEEVSERVRYVWVAFPPSDTGVPLVREIRMSP